MAMRPASWSASSRYCVVSNTVVPRSSLSERTSCHNAMRLMGSRPVVGSSRNNTCGECTSERARSRRRRIPPEYPPTRRSPAAVRPTRSRSSPLRRRASTRPMPCRVACSRSSSFPVMSGSMAASCNATPIERRTMSASVTTSYPATLADPPVGRSKVVSMRTVVDLPAPLGPRNPKISPSVTSRSTQSTAITSPKVRCRPVAWMGEAMSVLLVSTRGSNPPGLLGSHPVRSLERGLWHHSSARRRPRWLNGQPSGTWGGSTAGGSTW